MMYPSWQVTAFGEGNMSYGETRSKLSAMSSFTSGRQFFPHFITFLRLITGPLMNEQGNVTKS